LPARFQGRFDDDSGMFTTDDRISCGGVLMALSWSFDRLIREREKEAIGAVLDAVESLIQRYRPPAHGKIAPYGLYNAVITCFLENVLPTTPAGHPLVVPQLGPLTRGSVPPHWLLPDPNAKLAI
jgi:hypothetical protein